MPPVDSNEPTQAPAPEQPKKPGFWAKLFGKKETPAAPAPAPQPSDTVSAEPEQPVAQPSQPTAGVDVTPPATQPEQPADLSQPVPTVPADQQPQPLDVPSDLQAQGIDVDGTNVSPSLPTQPPAAGGEQPVSTPAEFPASDTQPDTDQPDQPNQPQQ